MAYSDEPFKQTVLEMRWALAAGAAAVAPELARQGRCVGGVGATDGSLKTDTLLWLAALGCSRALPVQAFLHKVASN
jgi:hypothetical protein